MTGTRLLARVWESHTLCRNHTRPAQSPGRAPVCPGFNFLAGIDDRKRFISARGLIDCNYGPLLVYESSRYFDLVCAWRALLAQRRKHVRCARVAHVLPSRMAAPVPVLSTHPLTAVCSTGRRRIVDMPAHAARPRGGEERAGAGVQDAEW